MGRAEPVSSDPSCGTTRSPISTVRERPSSIDEHRHVVDGGGGYRCRSPRGSIASSGGAWRRSAEDRWQTAADLLEALRWVSDGMRSSAIAAAAAPQRRSLVERLAWAAAVVVAASLAAWGWLRSEPAPPVTRFAFGVPPGATLSRERRGAVAGREDGCGRRGDRRQPACCIAARSTNSRPRPSGGPRAASIRFIHLTVKWLGFLHSERIEKGARGRGASQRCSRPSWQSVWRELGPWTRRSSLRQLARLT